MEKVKVKSLSPYGNETEKEFEQIGDIWFYKWPQNDTYLILEETRKRLENIPDESLYGFYKIGNILYEGYFTNELYFNELREREKGFRPSYKEIKDFIFDNFSLECKSDDYAGKESLTIKLKGENKKFEINVHECQLYTGKWQITIDSHWLDEKHGYEGHMIGSKNWLDFKKHFEQALIFGEIIINPTEVRAFKQLTIFDF